MQWSGDANTQSIVAAIALAATAAAHFCVFPELAVTGFHRQIRALARPAVDGSESDPNAHIKRAQMLARASRAFIVQANWPNSLNDPEESAEAGQRAVISPAGELLLRLPMAQPDIGIFDLGATHFAWHPQPG
jgi:predicted amidohydrolase